MGFPGVTITLLSLAFLKHSIYNYPIGSMYGIYIYTYIWLIFMVNVGEYSSPVDPMGIVGAHLVGNLVV